jgi:agmatinase
MASGRPADSLASPRFSGIRTFMRLPQAARADGYDFVVAGIPFDTGASYRVGARFGPMAIRDASALLRPFNPFPAPGIAIFDHLSGADLGDAPVIPGNIVASYERITGFVGAILEAGARPVLLGGDHSVALAELRAVHARHGPVALVQFDAHSDTWDAYWGERYTHGTPFRRAVEEGLVDPHHSIQLGLRGPLYGAEDFDVARGLGFTLVPAPELRSHTPETIAAEIRRVTDGRPVFLSFDVDFLDPSVAPGTGTPEVGGFFVHEAQAYLRALADLDIRAADVVECLPAYDHAELTALAAANIAYEIVSLYARRRAAG